MSEFRKPISDGRAATQARVAAQLISDALGETLILGHPADRCLRDRFRLNHQLGSRDRRLINSTFFAVLRWWGRLLPLLPDNFLTAWRQRDKQVPATYATDWYGALATALFLDAPDANLPQAAEFWLANLPAKIDRQKLRPSQKRDGQDLVPDFLAEYISRDLKYPLSELIEWQQKRPPVWLRLQTADTDEFIQSMAEDEIPVAKGKSLPDSARILSDNNYNLHNQKNFRNGEFEIQDLASQCVGHICNPQPGQQWWDTCAGSGGKTLHLAWLMQGKGSVMATDLRTFKLDELKLRARRSHFPNIRTKEWKGMAMPKFNGRFDGVLVDAPCTCSGTWRRNPGGRWTLTTEEIQEFPPLQLQLLENAAAGVKENGILIYSTCSMFDCENRGVVEKFLSRHPEFQLEPFQCPLTNTANDGCNQIWPWDGDCDAMFTAKLKKVKSEK